LQKFSGLKKLIPLILSIIIIYNSIGNFIALKVTQLSIKREIKTQLKKAVPADELVLIKLTDSDINSGRNGFRYYEKDKEFVYNDCMYDIVRKSTVNDTNYFYCINDKKEELLFKNLDFLVKNNLSNSIPAKKQSKAISLLIIKGEIEDSKINFESGADGLVLRFFINENIFNVYYDIITPPPEFFLIS
jgi:hypothetical protein